MKDHPTYSLSFRIALCIRNIVYFIVGILSKIQTQKPQLSVYCYHSISDDGWRFSVSEDEFKKQINYLLQHGKPVGLADVEAVVNGEKRLLENSFAITFDDGYKNILAVKDFLSGKGIRPAVFVLSDTKNANRFELNNNLEFLSKEELIDLHLSGWDIGCHSATHPEFLALNSEQIVSEIIDSKSYIEDILSTPIRMFAYPKGHYTNEILETVKRGGYKVGFSMDDAPVSARSNRYAIPRVGVDGTHSMLQFVHLASPLAVAFRSFSKKILSI